MRRLMILRHAKALRPAGTRDHERPLAPSGKAAARRISEAMRAEGLMPEAVLVSTARRTQETWEIARDLLTGETPPEAQSDFRIYEADADMLFALISEVDRKFRSLLVVGHNPGMSELAVFSAEPMKSDQKSLATSIIKFPTASLAVIDFNQEHWTLTRRTGRFWKFITPSMLGGMDED